MNELEKLKSEHARETIRHEYAHAALAPVTLDELKAALVKYNGRRCSIEFSWDESGAIWKDGGDHVFSFYSLREAVDFLTR